MSNTPMTPAAFRQIRRQQFMTLGLYEWTLVDATQRMNDALEFAQKSNQKEPGSLNNIEDHALLFYDTFNVWKLKYTAGVPIEELAPQVSTIVDTLENWEAANAPFLMALQKDFPKENYQLDVSACYLDQFDHYQELIQLTGLAVMLRDAQSIRRIARAMQYSREQDGLFESFISCYVDDPNDGFEVMHKNPWNYLLDAYYKEDDAEAIECVKTFCKKWYPAMKGLPWHDAHKYIEEKEINGRRVEAGRYYGYWAFEAGAVAYLLELGDSSIDHMVYPRDLVAYGNYLRDNDLWTSPDTPLDQLIVPPMRTPAGFVCPRTGYWFTPAAPSSRQRFEQGQIMPDVHSPAFDTIWQWDEHQE